MPNPYARAAGPLLSSANSDDFLTDPLAANETLEESTDEREVDFSGEEEDGDFVELGKSYAKNKGGQQPLKCPTERVQRLAGTRHMSVSSVLGQGGFGAVFSLRRARGGSDCLAGKVICAKRRAKQLSLPFELRSMKPMLRP